MAETLAAAPGEFGAATGQAARLARGIRRALAQRGYSALTEFSLANGRRVDVIAINGAGETIIVEIKTSLADFRADQKWGEYLEFCDVFYFAVPIDFPREALPVACGLMIADDYGAEILREAPPPSMSASAAPMNGSRRRAQNLRLALAAMQRLGRLLDPEM